MRLISRLVLVVVAVLTSGVIASSPAHAAVTPAFVQGSSAFVGTAGSTYTRAFSAAVTPGNMLIVSAGWVDSSNNVRVTCSDSQGNAYSTVAYRRYSNGESLATCIAVATAATIPTVTITFSNLPSWRGIMIGEYSGVAAIAAVDASATSVNSGGSGSTVSAAPITTKSDGDLIYAAWFGPGSQTAGVGFTRTNLAGNLMAEWTTQPAAGVFTATAVFPSANNAAQNVIALIPAQTERQVSAAVAVDPTFSFTVANHSGACNSFSQTAGVSSTPTGVALGRVNSGAGAVAAQDLIVGTNANTGFNLLLRTTGSLTSGSNTIADAPGTNAAPAAFPATDTAAFGYTVSGLARFSNAWSGATTSNQQVMTGVTVGTATNCIAYRVQVTAATPAGTYATTAIYTAVPNF